MAYSREGDTVTITITVYQYSLLMVMLGAATGSGVVAVETGMGLVDVINEGNSSYKPYVARKKGSKR